MSDVVVRALDAVERREFEPQVRALEAGIDYPLGSDRFEIDHGSDYYAFFERMGQLELLAAFQDDQLVGLLAFVLRELPDGPGWYACDLKVRPDRRGLGLARRMFDAVPTAWVARSPRCYSISMNPGDGSPNPIVDLAEARTPVRPVGELTFYSLDEPALTEARPLLTRHRGPVGTLSLGGVKDIVLRSTGAPMPLVHLQWGPLAERGEEVSMPAAIHMLCTPAGDGLDRALGDAGLSPSASATVLAFGPFVGPWDWVLTSDI
jgi:GNAT superfamily N-acetyltransferase